MSDVIIIIEDKIALDIDKLSWNDLKTIVENDGEFVNAMTHIDYLRGKVRKIQDKELL